MPKPNVALDKEDDDEKEDSSDFEEAFANFAAREALERVEEMIETQNTLVEKLVNKLVSDRAGVETTLTRYKVKVIRDAKGMISELDINPVTQTRVVN